MLIGSMTILLKNMGMYPHPSRPFEGMSILGIYTAMEDYMGEEVEGNTQLCEGIFARCRLDELVYLATQVCEDVVGLEIKAYQRPQE
jgi:hypothetical protein